MSVAAVAFVPSAPLLVPQVAGGSASLDAALRTASLDVVARALACSPDEVVVVAATAEPGTWDETFTWSFGGFGVERTPADERPTVPWSLGIGAWLLDECGWSGSRRYIGVVAADGATAPVLSGDRVAVIAVGDGSACRTERAPGHLDERAEAFDDGLTELLARGDARGLGRVNEELAGDLLCVGSPVWRWVSAAVGGSEVREAELSMHVAPYGVAYFVALWSLR